MSIKDTADRPIDPADVMVAPNGFLADLPVGSIDVVAVSADVLADPDLHRVG